MATPLLVALLQVILHYATAVNVTAADGSGEHRLLRRETTKFKLWEEMVEAATGQQITPNFLPEVRQCNYSKAEQMHLEATHRRSDTQRGLKEVKEVMADQNVPLILLGGLALEHHSFCAAMVNDMDRVVATFGSWLEEQGLEPLRSAFHKKGHVLDTKMCKDGPMTAGCKLTVFLFAAHGKLPQHLAFEIQVLSSAPPPAVARLPGRFRSCAAVCGEHCEACTLAYASWSESSKAQGRFFPCPVPLRNFVLAAWMNDTFWVPDNMETYMQAEYGTKHPQVHQSPHQSCSSQSLSPYETMVAGLPKGSEVLALQRNAEEAHLTRIAAAASHDRRLWRKSFIEDSNSKSQTPWRFAVETKHVWRWPSVRIPFLAHLTVRHFLLALGTVLSVGASYVVLKRFSMCSRPGFLLRKMLHPSDGGMYAIYMAILLAQTFSQHLANTAGLFALAATILWQLAHALWAAGVVWTQHGFAGVGLLMAKLIRGQAGGSAWLFGLLLLLSCCTAVSQWLSFISLSWLDPASYILCVQVPLLLAEVAGSLDRKFCRAHALASALVILAIMVKGLQAATDRDAMLYRGLVTVLIQVLLSSLVLLCRPVLQEVSISRELLVLAQSLQGLVLLPVIYMTIGGSNSPKALLDDFSEVVSNQWLVTSIAFMLVSSILKSELPRVEAPIEELGVAGLLVKSAGLQWFLLKWGGGDAHDLQASFLGLLALAVCFAEHMASLPVPALPAKPPKPPPVKVVPAAQPKALAKKLPASRLPPRPPWRAKVPGLRKDSDLGSEISTTAPPTPRGSVPVTILQPQPRLKVQEESSSGSDLSSEWTSDSE